jgi:hypothetical protein
MYQFVKQDDIIVSSFHVCSRGNREILARRLTYSLITNKFRAPVREIQDIDLREGTNSFLEGFLVSGDFDENINR